MLSSLDIASSSTKTILSCDFCRKRKLRCTRERPNCQACIRHKRICHYIEAKRLAPGAGQNDSAGRDRIAELLARIDKLESRVGEASSGEPQGHVTPTNARGDGVHREDSQVSTAAVQDSTYTSSTHWSALLQELDSVKEVIATESDTLETATEEAGPDRTMDSIMMGLLVFKYVTTEDILQILPDRAVSDKLVNLFFTASQDPAVLIFHAPTFQTEYLAFWKTTANASLTFIATLFGTFALATEVARRTGRALPTLSESSDMDGSLFRDAAASAVVLSGCLSARKLPKYYCHALILLTTSHFYKNTQSLTLICQLTSAIVRMAMQAGYHREPAKLTRISAYEGEMQRRLWGYIVAMDTMLSFQAGQLRLIQDWHYDTQLPSNLYDADFNEHSTTLPSSRPETELTPVCYLRAKVRLMQVFGMITDAANNPRPVSNDTIFDLDTRLQQVYASLPQALQMEPQGHSLLDPPITRMRRYNFTFQYLKARCVLHRRSLSAHFRHEPRTATSRRICIDAALKTLQYQADLHEEIQPGGAFYQERWFVTWLQLNEFLLASMVICFEVHMLQQGRNHANTSLYGENHSVVTLVKALERSLSYLYMWTSFSEDARKAAKVLAISLGKQIVPDEHTTGSMSTQHVVPVGPTTTSTVEPCLTMYDGMHGQFFDSSFEEFLNLPTVNNLDYLNNADLEMFDSWIFSTTSMT